MLELRGISLQADDGKAILRDIDLTISDSKFIVVTGPNGSGKSTLAKVIMGIMRPTAGQILLDGEDITTLGVTERARKGLGFSFQQPVRFKGLTVRDLLELAAGGALSQNQTFDVLREVGLCPRDYVNRELNDSLSGGEAKRVEIAMALLRRSGLTIFDEPEAGIDLWSFGNLIEVFRKLRRENGGSILTISHQERILEIADELVVLAEGRIQTHGTREAVLPNLLCAKSCEYCRKEERS